MWSWCCILWPWSWSWLELHGFAAITLTRHYIDNPMLRYSSLQNLFPTLSRNFCYNDFPGFENLTSMLLCFRLTSSFIHKITKLRFAPPCGGTKGNISALSESFNAKKLCSRVFFDKMSVLFVEQWSSVSVPPFGGLGGNVCDSSLARCQLPIGYDWTFFTSSYGWGTMSESQNWPLLEGVGHFEAKYLVEGLRLQPISITVW